jgi:trigger factor
MRAAKTGDSVLIDFTGFRDGVKFDGGESKDYELELGSNSFIPGFESGIEGHTAGDEFDIDVTFPKDYGSRELAGQKAVFKISLKEVRELSQPKIDDAFAETVSPEFKKLSDLKKDVRRELEQREQQNLDGQWRDALIEKIIEKSDVPTPAVLVEDQAGALVRDFEQNLAGQGLKLDDYLKDKKLTEKQWRDDEVHPAAEKRVKGALVMRELAQQFQIVATDAEVNAAQKELLSHYNNPELQQHFSSDQAKRDLVNQIITEKIFKKLTELNKR